MKAIGVDMVSLVDFADLIFEEQGMPRGGDDAEAQDIRISFSAFVKQVLLLRGSNTATVKDMVDLRWWLSKSLQSKLEATVEKILIGRSGQPCINKANSAPM